VRARRYPLLRGAHAEIAVTRPLADATLLVSASLAVAGCGSEDSDDSGRPTLALVGDDGLCPIVGLLRPPPELAER
jgi:hypothetical protein